MSRCTIDSSTAPPIDITKMGFGAVLEFHIPLEPVPGADDLRTVAYGTGGAGGRDLHLSVRGRSDRSERRPGILFVHGGGWLNGSAAFHIRHVREMAARGWVAATATYRRSREAPWPAHLEDVKCAVRCLRANAARLGMDPDRLVVAGGSAGGHLSAMVALTPGDFEGTGGNAGVSSAVSAAVLWYPATDLHELGDLGPSHPVIAQLLGEVTEEAILSASPITYVSSTCPPVLTMTGDADPGTKLSTIGRFHDALDGAGVVNELVVFEGRGHAFDFHPVEFDQCLEIMTSFLEDKVISSGAVSEAAAS